MYRNCMVRSCEKSSNSLDKDEVLEDSCNDVITLSDYDKNDCSCGFDDNNGPFPENPMYGNSYVPNQALNTTFLPNVALKLGTLYPELVRPYYPGQSMAEIEYLRKTNPIKEGCNRV